MLTKNGVCYDIEESPYYHDCHGFRFYFSSLPHLAKFKRDCLVKEEWLTDSLSRRFKFMIDATVLAVFQLYTQVETRGFYIVAENGHEYRNLSEVKMKVGF